MVIYGRLRPMVGGRRTSLKLTLFPCFPRAPFSPGRPGGPVGPSSPFSPWGPACRYNHLHKMRHGALSRAYDWRIIQSLIRPFLFASRRGTRGSRAKFLGEERNGGSRRIAAPTKIPRPNTIALNGSVSRDRSLRNSRVSSTRYPDARCRREYARDTRGRLFLTETLKFIEHEN